MLSGFRFALAVCCLHLATSFAGAAELAPVRVFILAGQSNMEGQGVVDLDHPQYYNGGKGTLLRVMSDPANKALFAHVKDADGQWVVRDDVLIRFRTKNEIKRGGLSIGFTGYPGKHHIGPEFQFGHVVGKAFEEPVLLIKTAWGGKSLFKDFRPPSAGGETGPYYRQMIAEVREALASADDDFPMLTGRKRLISGFVWMQGWNDMFNEQARAEYEQNLVHLITDVRAEFKVPELPAVIGELGNGGPKASGSMLTIREAQKAAADRPDFNGTVAFVPTAAFARPAQESPNVGHGHHWFGNAESYFLIGDALGRSMLTLLGKRPQPDRDFSRWDRNADGHLVRSELPERIRGNFDRVDADGNGFISLIEHLAVVGRRTDSDRVRGPRLPDNVTLQRDIPYAGTNNPRQMLDLLLPKQRSTDSPLPVIAFVHGGGWRNGNKTSGIGRVSRFVQTGEYAAVSIGYRLSDESKWPAQIHDCKAAIRWLKANARQHNLDPERIAVFGTSAGGHLVAMLGVSGGVNDLDGALGDHTDEDGRVAAVIDFFGPTNFLTMNDHPSRIDHNAADSPESQLIDGAIQENKARARHAAPLSYVSADDAPILIMHGTHDELVPYAQSASFHAALKKVNVPSVFVTVTNGEHGFHGTEIDARVDSFLQRYLLGREVSVSPEPVSVGVEQRSRSAR